MKEVKQVSEEKRIDDTGEQNQKAATKVAEAILSGVQAGQWNRLRSVAATTTEGKPCPPRKHSLARRGIVQSLLFHLPLRSCGMQLTRSHRHDRAGRKAAAQRHAYAPILAARHGPEVVSKS